jgi:hypothetical protein
MSDKNDQNVLSNAYRQPETVQLSPDALVFINGSNLLVDTEGNTVDIRQDITEISTSLSTDQSPGSANFTISYPEHSGGRRGMSKYKNLMMMSEVVIYFRGRFLKQDPKDSKKTKYPYYQAFWGVISAITENYSDGVHTISVSCADILRWWQITNMVINPSLLSTTEQLDTYLDLLGVDKKDKKTFLSGKAVKHKIEKRDLSIFSNIFSNKTIPEIFQACCQLSLLQMMPLKDNLRQQIKAVPVGKDLRDKITNQQMTYWAERLNQVGRSLRIYGLRIDPDGEFKGRLNIDMSKVISLGEDDEKKSEGTPTVVIQMFPSAPPIAKSDRKSQLEIANEVKEAIQFEFFMDVNGDIVLKPPFYNLDVTSNAPVSYLEDLDILNWNFVQSESEVVTRVDVTGAFSKFGNVALADPVGTANNPLLQLQFGERPIQRSMPWLHDANHCYFWGRSELTRQNALIRQGTITIVGRPELRLGYPVFVPSRDAFYYVKGIEHRFTFGGTFNTTLTVVAERAQTGNKLGLFKNIGELTDGQISVLGGSNSEPNSVNNFVKQISMPSICTPRAKEHVAIVEPNFTIDLTKTKSDVIGEWHSFTEAVAEPDKNNFQLTDDKGYEIIGQVGQAPYVTYGYKTSLQNDLFQQNQTEKQKASEKALSMDVKNSTLTVSPNNATLALDDENSKMVDFGHTDFISSAAKAHTGIGPLYA